MLAPFRKGVVEQRTRFQTAGDVQQGAGGQVALAHPTKKVSKKAQLENGQVHTSGASQHDVGVRKGVEDGCAVVLNERGVHRRGVNIEKIL